MLRRCLLRRDRRPMPRRSRVDVVALDALAATQHRCVSLAQLSEVGMPTSTTAYRTRPSGGSWSRPLPGVVLLHRGTPTADERAAAALLYAGPGSVLTGVESLRRHGLRRLPTTDLVHVLVPDDRRRVSAQFVVCERTERLPRPTAGIALPTATLARSLVDASRRTLVLDLVRAMVAEAVQRRLCPQGHILEEVRLAQRRGSARVRLVAGEIVGGIRSVVEADARAVLRRGGLPPALWNHDLVTPSGELVGCPDAWFDDEGVALEIDSREWHLDPQGWERTQLRRARFASFGVISVPITPQRLREPESVLRDLRATLAAARRRPRPDVRAVLRSQAA